MEKCCSAKLFLLGRTEFQYYELKVPRTPTERSYKMGRRLGERITLR